MDDKSKWVRGPGALCALRALTCIANPHAEFKTFGCIGSVDCVACAAYKQHQGALMTIRDAIADLERLLAAGDGDLRPVIEDLKRGLSWKWVKRGLT